MAPTLRIDTMKGGDLGAVASIQGPTRMEQAQLQDELARPWSRLWVAREEGDTVVAFVVSWHVVDELHVLNIATRAELLETANDLFDMVAARKISIDVTKEYPLRDAARAHADLEARKTTGAIVLRSVGHLQSVPGRGRAVMRIEQS